MAISEPPRPVPRILVIEDDTSTRNALASWLAYEYEVITAADGVEGLEVATQQKPDLILADVWMPNLDGVAMVKHLKSTDTLRRVPVIFLTGQTSTASVIAGIAAGARAYLYKPVDLDLLDRKIKSALYGRAPAR